MKFACDYASHDESGYFNSINRWIEPGHQHNGLRRDLQFFMIGVPPPRAQIAQALDLADFEQVMLSHVSDLNVQACGCGCCFCCCHRSLISASEGRTYTACRSSDRKSVV